MTLSKSTKEESFSGTLINSNENSIQTFNLFVSFLSINIGWLPSGINGFIALIIWRGWKSPVVCKKPKKSFLLENIAHSGMAQHVLGFFLSHSPTHSMHLSMHRRLIGYHLEWKVLMWKTTIFWAWEPQRQTPCVWCWKHVYRYKSKLSIVGSNLAIYSASIQSLITTTLKPSRNACNN